MAFVSHFLSHNYWNRAEDTSLTSYSTCTQPMMNKGFQQNHKHYRHYPACLNANGKPSYGKTGKAIITVDVGTSSVKSALYFMHPKNAGIEEKRVLGEVIREEHDTFTDNSGVVTQKPTAWYNGVVRAISKVIKRAPGHEIIALSVTGQMQDLIVVGRDPPDLLKHDSMLYSDARAVDEARALSAKLGVPVLATSLLAKLKLLPNPSKSMAESPHYKLLFGAADYIVYRVCGDTGVTVTDATTVSTTGLSIGPAHREYDLDVLERSGLRHFAGYFPEILESNHVVVGQLCESVARDIGLPHLKGIDVIHAGGDAFSATTGTGCDQVKKGAYLYAGTTGWIAATIDLRDDIQLDAVLNNKSLFCLGHAVDRRYGIVAASVINVGSAFRQACEQFQCNVEDLDELAAKSCIGSNGVVFIPYVSGRRCPDPIDVTRGGFYGMSASTTRSDLIQSVIEGVVFSFADAARQLPVDVGLECLQVTGGVSKCETFLQGISALIGETNGCETEGGLVGAGRTGQMAIGGESRGDSDGDENLLDRGDIREAEGVALTESWKRAYGRWRVVLSKMERIWMEFKNSNV